MSESNDGDGDTLAMCDEDLSTSFKWTIQDYSTQSNIVLEAINPRLFSSKFGMFQGPECEWRLVLKFPKPESCHCCTHQRKSRHCFMSKGTNENIQISIYLKNCKTYRKPVSLEVNFSILGDNNRKVFTRNKIISDVLADSEEYGIDNFILQKEIEKLMVNGNITILCEIQDIFRSRIPPKVSEFFINNESFSDVVIQVGEKKFFAHKIILASRSLFFNKIFSINAEKSERNEVHICNVEPDIFFELLKFMYTGKTDNLKCLKEIFIAAHLYHIYDLRYFCERSMKENITIENSISTWKLAHRCDARDLKNDCMDFIQKNLKSIKQLESFKSLTLCCPELLYEILMNSE